MAGLFKFRRTQTDAAGGSVAPQPTTTNAPAERAADVVIVGAGLAGLTAARRLVAQGVDVLVVEARDRVGGRTYTRPAKDGTLLDLGGQWVGPMQSQILALAQEVGSTIFPMYNTGNNIQQVRGERHTYSGAIPMADPMATMEAVEQMLNLSTMAQVVPLEAPWDAPLVAEWDAQTVETWMQANVTEPGAQALLTLAVRAVFSVEPRDLSLLHMLFYIHSAGNLNNLVGVTRAAQESRFHEGAQSVSNKVAQALGERVILNTPVRSVFQDDAGVRVVGETLSVRAQRAIIAIPPTLAGRLHYQPLLPALRDQMTQRMPMGTVIKVQCVYPTPFWRADGFSGQVTCDSAMVSITYDNSPESGAAGVLLGFVEGDEGRRWGDRDPAERRAAALHCFVDYFGPQAAEPIDYVEQIWSREEFSRGCYAGYFGPGGWTMYGKALREPIGRLHWAGTETATVWNGYMDGAVQSGYRAADEIVAALGQ